MGVLYCLFAVASYAIYISCAPMSDNSRPDLDRLDGQSLIKLGRKLNNPVLTIVGLTLKEFHRCSEWTQWSDCNARFRYFGTRSRQRKCRQNSEKLENEGTNTLETDLGLCEGHCPLDYNFTESGFCLKLYKTTATQDDSKKQCRQDGGNLINIDSDRKHQDVRSLLQGISQYIFIDGRRKDLSSPWLFSYGSPKIHIEWFTGQPDDASISLCLMLDEAESRLLHDVSCEIGRYFLCEIS